MFQNALEILQDNYCLLCENNCKRIFNIKYNCPARKEKYE